MSRAQLLQRGAVEEHPPRRRLSRRASPRSSVDLPEAFAPTMTVKHPSGMRRARCSTTSDAVVAQREPVGSQLVGGHPPAPWS